MALTEEQKRKWMEQWRAAGPALQEMRDKEAREMSPEERALAALSLLSLPRGESAVRVERDDEENGLVIQQRIFSRAWKK